MATKSKLAKNKRNNQKRNKLVKKGAIKTKKPKRVQADVPKIVPKKVEEDEVSEESDHGEDMLGMVDDDDLEFLKSAINNRSYSLLDNVRYTERPNKAKKRKLEEDEDETVEAHYESEIKAPVNLKSLLPIKTKSGVVRVTVEQEEDEETEEEFDDEQEEEEATAENNEEGEDSDGGEYVLQESGLDLSKPVTSVQLLAARDELLQKKKLHIGTLSSGLLENPEEKTVNFRTLLKILDEDTPEVFVSIKKLAMVSLLEVFKDLLPSYEIKLQDITNVKLKKDTLKLHKYEENLLQYYKKYLQKLEKFAGSLYRKKGDARVRTSAQQMLGEVAVHAMCDLLIAHPYFNYAQNLAQAIVPFLNNPNKNVRQLVTAACKTVFKEDKKEEITLQIMRIINQYLRNHSHNVNPNMLEVLLVLRIKEVNLDREKEQEMKQKKLESHKQNILSMSKKEKKRKKRLQELEKEMLETKAQENLQSKQKNVTEITKLLFGIYFRILKSSTNTKVLGVCLEGLAKYAHCLNLEYYVDIVNVLDRLLKEEWLGYREKLHCVQTMFSILGDQGEVLNIDPSRFYGALYKDLLTTHASRTYANFEVLLQTIVTAIIKRRKRITNKRTIGFLKRLATLSLQLLHNGSLSCLAVIKVVMQLSKSADILLDLDNSGGDAKYDAEVNDPEYSGASSTALYELVPLARHYNSVVAKYAKHIAAGVPATGEGSLPSEYAKRTPEQLCKDFDMSEMAFTPAVLPPKVHQPKARAARLQFVDNKFKKMCYDRVRMCRKSEDIFYIHK